jgi:hypothetical protein
VEVLVPGFAVYHADNLTVINGGSVRADAKLDLGRITENIGITAQGTPRPQWRYKPTLLNGEPVEVVTTITLNFTLAQ